jgi:polysaccharide pyruvyl transferase WcaK-like protein
MKEEKIYKKPLTFCVLDANMRAGNLGLSALSMSIVKGLASAFGNARVMLHGFMEDSRQKKELSAYRITVEPIEIFVSNKLRRRTGTSHLKALTKILHRLPMTTRNFFLQFNRTLRQLTSTDYILDITAGDAFTDTRYDKLVRPLAFKLLAKELGKPLILMPQTYGPFTQEKSRKEVRAIIDYCILAATREVDGISELAELFGRKPKNVTSCPDVAFSLDPVPTEAGNKFFSQAKKKGNIIIGLNVSGLLYFPLKDYGLKSEYRDVIDAIAKWSLTQPNVCLFLVPHVLSLDSPEVELRKKRGTIHEISDTTACSALMSRFGMAAKDKSMFLKGSYTAGEMKYLIGQCDFFIGTRMHSCIAATSSCIATAALAYSKKAKGVMSWLGIDNMIIDLRSTSAAECVEKIDDIYKRRGEIKEKLKNKIPQIKLHVEDFFTRQLRGAIESEKCAKR